MDSAFKIRKGDKNMYSIHFYEDNTYLLNKASRIMPSVNENVRIKGRNGIVIKVQEMGENKHFVFVEFEKLVDKSKPALKKRKK
jgi:hypothetical protein